MSAEPLLDATASVVIVGASLAGLRAAERLRHLGFRSSLILIGDEPHEPYDRPPLSKQVALGMAPAERTRLPRLADLGDGEWRKGVAAAGRNRALRKVRVADRTTVSPAP